MKYLVSLLVFGVVVCALPTPDEFKTELKEAREECKKELELDGDTVKKIAKGESKDDKVVGPFFFCVSKKMGAMDDKGNIDHKAIEEKMKDLFPNKKALDDAMEKCLVEEDSAEKTATHAALCMTTELREHGVNKDDDDDE